jgi:hypothetical protein
LIGLLVALAGCAKPPEPPAGLDDSARWLLREATADDLTVAAGLAGLLAWVDDEGAALQDAASDDPTAFTLADLTPADVAALPLDADVETSRDGAAAPRDPAAAAGVVAIATVDCALTEAERLLLRPDQDLVYPDDFTTYDRTFAADPVAFLAAWDDGPPPQREAVTPWDPGFDADAAAASLIIAASSLDPAPVFGGLADIGPYDLDLLVRHGTFDVPDVGPVEVVLAVGAQPRAAWGTSGGNGLVQSYTLDVSLTRDGGLVRVMASWSEPRGIAPDSAMALRGAVDKSRESAARWSALCADPLPAWP